MSFLSMMRSNVQPAINSMRQIGRMADELDNLSKLISVYSSGGNVMEAVSRLGQADNGIASFAQTIKGRSDAELRAAAEELARRKGIDLNQFSAMLANNLK